MNRIAYLAALLVWATGTLPLTAEEPPARSSNGLIGYWKLDDGTGQVAADASGSGSNCVAPDDVPLGWLVGGAGSSLWFNGFDEHLRAADASRANLAGSLSIEFWMRPADWAQRPSQGIVSKKRSDADPGYVVYNDGRAPSKLTIRLKGTSGAADFVSRSDVTPRQWQHWAVTYDAATKTAAWYRDGQPDGVHQAIAVGDMTSAAKLEIGHSQTWNGYYCGALAELRIYNRALTGGEVRSEYLSGASSVPSRPAQDWRPAKWRVVATRYPTSDLVVAGCTVQEFGAKGDSVGDDTVPFRRALRSMAENGGGTVFVPEGRYVIRGTLSIPTAVTLRGERPRWSKGQPVRGTVLMAHAGRRKKEGRSFISLLQCSGIKDLSIWYPEQEADAIVPYPFCLQQAGFDNATIEDVTLVNPYQGIAIGPQYNELHYIRNVCGSPLALGVEIDSLTDTGRHESIGFGPDIWSDSGLPGAPGKDGPHARWMYQNGTAMRMCRVDTECGAFDRFSGYRVGIEMLPSPRGTPYVGFYGCRISNCATALSVVDARFVGVQFTDCTFEGVEKGIATADSFQSALLFHSCFIRGKGKAADLRGRPDSISLFERCRFEGEFARESGDVSLVGCAFDAPGTHITLGEGVNAATVVGSTFNGTPRIVNRSPSEHILVSDQPVTLPRVPPVPQHEERALRPATTDLYVVTSPEWGAKKDGATDDTAAIQKALSAAAKSGGGVVFLPGGEYAVRGRLVIPPGVEMRGVFGDCRNELQFHNAVFGARCGLRFAGQNGAGASGIVLGHVTDGAKIAAAFERLGPRGIDLVNTQLACLASTDKRYIVCGEQLQSEVRFFNTCLWGDPQSSAVVSSGSLVLLLAHFSQHAPFVVEGGALSLVNTSLDLKLSSSEDLIIRRGGRAALLGNLTTYGMRWNADAPPSSVSARDQNQRCIAGAQEISVVLGETQRQVGMSLREKDGESENVPGTRGGRPCWVGTRKVGKDAYYMYYVIRSPEFRSGRIPRAKITVEYFDAGAGSFRILYDSSDESVRAVPASPGAWKTAALFQLTDTQTWKTFECRASDALFKGRCNGGDLRFDIQSGDVRPAIASVKITRAPD